MGVLFLVTTESGGRCQMRRVYLQQTHAMELPELPSGPAPPPPSLSPPPNPLSTNSLALSLFLYSVFDIYTYHVNVFSPDTVP